MAPPYLGKIYDAMNKDTTFEDIRAQIEAYKPDFVMSLDYLPVTGAISTATVPAALKALGVAKEVDPAIVTMIGGPHPTFMYEEMLSDEANTADYILRGESEATLIDLMATLGAGGSPDDVKGIAFARDGKIVATPMRPHIADLDTLEVAWHLLDWEDYHYNVEPWGRMASVLTSRGCMMGCSFCSQRLFWRGDWRARDPQKAVDEMRISSRSTRSSSSRSSTRTRPATASAGIEMLDLLIEAEPRRPPAHRDPCRGHHPRRGHPPEVPRRRHHPRLPGRRDEHRRDAQQPEQGHHDRPEQAGHRPAQGARHHDRGIVHDRLPGETQDSIKVTIAEAVRLNPDIAVFPVITPMPFTPLWDEMKDRIRVWDYSKYNLVTPIIEPYAMTMEDITIALGRCYMTFYASKMTEILALPDGFKRRYMLSAMKEMMKDYGEHFDFLGIGMARSWASACRRRWSKP